MKIRTNIAMFGQGSGLVVDLDDVDAEALIANNFAIRVDDDAPEAAVIVAPENAAAPKKPRGRKAVAPKSDD